ncbi:MAG: TetR/AcrR family transcriptional regulator [Actinobacteria bacterium]|nr:TetR/AcrR family transcriptional regulator [Actinomycetota bacterium]
MPRSPRGNTRDQLTAALIELVAGEGMDRASVREVATAAGVAIGTVQYHFPTRRDLLTGAFEAVVHGVRDRLALPAARADADPAATVVAILRELVPLDAPRRREAAVMVAFAAAAVHEPELAALQGDPGASRGHPRHAVLGKR